MKRRYFAGRNQHGLRAVLRLDEDLLVEVYAREAFAPHKYAGAAKEFFCNVGKSPSLVSVKEAWNGYIRGKGYLNEILDDLSELEVPPGHRIPRISRSTHAHPGDPPIPNAFSARERSELQQGKAELVNHLGKLRNICRTVQPEGSNLEAYGIAISELHVVACIGVEGHFRSMLNANGYGKTRLSTRDFVKLLKPARLDEYHFEFSSYPWLNSVAPFSLWDPKKPTSSLEWYERYNRAKHNPYKRSDGPNLSHVFESVCAFATLLIAQYGDRPVRGTFPEIYAILNPTGYPKWASSELYVNPKQGKWISHRLRFSQKV